MSEASEKIIIALDVETLEQARELVECLSGTVGAFKIGKQLFTRCGPEAVAMVHAAGEPRVSRPEVSRYPHHRCQGRL